MQVTDEDGKITIHNNALTSKKAAPKKRDVNTKQYPNIVQFFAGLFGKFKDLNLTLFWGAIIAYGLIISFAIDKWPIYFFTDEAIHMNMIADFMRNGYQNYTGEFLPTFFIKEGWVNGTSVYLQLLPYLMFGKSVIVTRLVSAVITLIGAIAIGLLLSKYSKRNIIGQVFFYYSPPQPGSCMPELLLNMQKWLRSTACSFTFMGVTEKVTCAHCISRFSLRRSASTPMGLDKF